MGIPAARSRIVFRLAKAAHDNQNPTMKNEQAIQRELTHRLSPDWTEGIEEYARVYQKLAPDQVQSLTKNELWVLWVGKGFADVQVQFPTPNPGQLQELRNATKFLVDRSKSLGDRFCGALESLLEAVRLKDFTLHQVQRPVILRTLLILEGGTYGTVASVSKTNVLLDWADKPEPKLDLHEAASFTHALENVKTLIGEWAPRVGATKLGERAQIPWHLYEIIK